MTSAKTPRAKKAAKPDAAPEEAPETVLVLRTADANRRSYGGFQWPVSGRVEAPDWKPTTSCGNGLHGLLAGLGDFNLLTMGEGETVQVVEVERKRCIDLGGKVKFPFGEVKLSGKWSEAFKLILPAMQKEIRSDIAKQIEEAKAATTGNYAPAATTGDNAPAATTGDNAPAATTGFKAPAATTGDNAPAATTGFNAPAATTGNYAPAATTGDNAPAATTGFNAPAATTGDNAPAATTGDNAPAATTGFKAPAATTGDNAPAATTGDNAPAATTGNYAPAATTGKHSVAAAIGPGSTAKAAETGAIMLAAYGDWDGESYPLLAVFAGMVGQTYGSVTIKPGMAYRLGRDGVPVEVTDQ